MNVSNDHNEMSPFAKAMSDVFTLAAKNEGASIKLLCAMFYMDSTFDQAFCEKFAKAKGKDKTEIMHSTLSELVPTFDEVKNTAKFNLKSLDSPSEANRMADKKEDSQKKLKTAENTFRNVAKALTFLRMGPMVTDEKTNEVSFKTPITKIETKGIKLRYSTGEGWYSQQWSSFSDLLKFGEGTITRLGWIIKQASNANAGANTSVVNTANKVKAMGDHFKNAGRELSNGLIAWLGHTDYDEVDDSTLESLRNLELNFLLKVYAGKDGLINIDTLVEQCEGYNTSIKKRDKDARKAA